MINSKKTKKQGKGREWLCVHEYVCVFGCVCVGEYFTKDGQRSSHERSRPGKDMEKLKTKKDYNAWAH